MSWFFKCHKSETKHTQIMAIWFWLISEPIEINNYLFIGFNKIFKATKNTFLTAFSKLMKANVT